jgi:DNA replication and repair protein RecF
LRLEAIRIANFRNHRLLEFEPGPSITVIHGNNGSGKTSILEAVHFCALTRGFAGSADRECVMFGCDHFMIRSAFISDRGQTSEVRVAYSAEKEKQVFVNELEITSFSRHIGAIPCVTFTPSELAIVNASPSDRRRFIDSAICQHDRRYLADMMQYRRILQQRNALLAGGVETPSGQAGLEIWTEQMAVLAASIVLARREFLRKFSVIFNGIHAWFPGQQEPSIEYHSTLGPVGEDDGVEDLKSSFISRFRQLRNQEMLRRQTLAGPHRDDLRLFFDGHEIRKYASQGQQRSYLIAMKLALRRYLYESAGEQPIMLLDDLFSELDEEVAGRIIESLASCGQVLITSTDEKKSEGIMNHSLEKDTKTRS